MEPFTLADYNPGDTRGMSETECETVLLRNRERIAELLNVLYAEKRRSLLVILQSMDTGGKDPIIKDVLQLVNPQASRVNAFKKATADEERHDRFWRFHLHVPQKGELGVFNRAYYDDIVRARAHGDMDNGEAKRQYDAINRFECLLDACDIRVIKLFLHISKEEQKRRLQERIDNPQRHWELSASDFSERKYWDGYMRAYEEAIRSTQNQQAPWHVITADRKWFRDARASEIIVETLESLGAQYPPPSVDLTDIEWHD